MRGKSGWWIVLWTGCEAARWGIALEENADKDPGEPQSALGELTEADRKNIAEWLGSVSPVLAELYGSFCALVYGPIISGRARLIAHCVREMRSCLLWYKDPKSSPSPEVISRLTALWEMTIAEGRENTNENPFELAEFGLWFASQKFESNWALDQLGKVLDRGVDLQYKAEVIEALEVLFEKEPMAVATRFDQFVRWLRNSWDIDMMGDEFPSLLRKLLTSKNNGVQRIGKKLIQYLGSLGRLEYRDLLSSRQPQTEHGS